MQFTLATISEAVSVFWKSNIANKNVLIEFGNPPPAICFVCPHAILRRIDSMLFGLSIVQLIE